MIFLILLPLLNIFFVICNRVTIRVVATNQCENGLYMLENGHHSLISTYSPCIFFNVWHACLGHVSNSIISFLNKNH